MRWKRGFPLSKLTQTCASPTQLGFQFVDEVERMLDEKLKGEESIEECIKMMRVLSLWSGGKS
jgi:hypothetical protein